MMSDERARSDRLLQRAMLLCRRTVTCCIAPKKCCYATFTPGLGNDIQRPRLQCSRAEPLSLLQRLRDLNIDILLTVPTTTFTRHTLPLVINCIRSFSRGAVAVLLRAPADGRHICWGSDKCAVPRPPLHDIPPILASRRREDHKHTCNCAGDKTPCLFGRLLECSSTCGSQPCKGGSQVPHNRV